MIEVIIRNAPVIGLLIFFLMFCLILINTFKPKSKKKYQDYAKIALKDDK